MFTKSLVSARLAMAMLTVVMVAGCASNSKSQSDNSAEEFGFEEKNPDKFENINRKVFAFNMKVDSWLLKPLARGYDYIAPAPVELGVNNFFNNINEVRNVFNDVLQWKWKQAGNDAGRFVLNSTIGLLGFVDVARHAGLKKNEGEDFGQTLAAWGVPQGPYIVLPFLGPATVRSTLGSPADWYVSPLREITPKTDRYAVVGAGYVRLRANFLEAEKLVSGDMYLFLRDAYLQRRKYLLNDGVVEDDFGGDDFGDDEFDL